MHKIQWIANVTVDYKDLEDDWIVASVAKRFTTVETWVHLTHSRTRSASVRRQEIDSRRLVAKTVYKQPMPLEIMSICFHHVRGEVCIVAAQDGAAPYQNLEHATNELPTGMGHLTEQK
jgi:hypothetical protein